MGSWTPLTIQPSFKASTMLLLTDGTVMCQAEGSKSWWKLSPDSGGSYVNGSWAALADMVNSRLYYASAVLADGRVLVAGGEYSDGGSDADKAEIYDPLSNAWTSIPTPGWGWIGDASACLLADGRLLLGSLTDARTAIYNPSTNTWTATGTMAARSNEETWVLLPDGSVVTVDCSNHPNAERFVPSSGAWVGAGATPIELVQASSIEIGPGVLLPTGRVFMVGATGHTALYTPPSGGGTGTWQAGPDFPADSQGRLVKAKDAPGCLLPNGHVLCVAGPAGDGAGDWPSPTMFFEFDGVGLNRVTDPPNANTVTYEGRLLLLPTGQVLYAAGTSAIYVYTPTGYPDPAWRPTITNCPSSLLIGHTYTLQGTQLNGLSQAASYGDDAQMATNYPLVRLHNVSSGGITYCRTAHHSTMGVATGAAVVSTTFTVPAGIPAGNYELYVVANGISSDPVNVTCGPDGGTAHYMLVDKAFGGGSVLWAYAGSQWRYQYVSDADLSGIAEDVFRANRVDVWWDESDRLTLVRPWKNE